MILRNNFDLDGKAYIFRVQAQKLSLGQMYVKQERIALYRGAIYSFILISKYLVYS